MGVTAAFIVSVLLCPFIAVKSDGWAGFFGGAIVTIGFIVLTYFAGRASLLPLFLLMGMVNSIMLCGARKPRYSVMSLLTTFCSIAFCQVAFTSPALGTRMTDDFLVFLSSVNLIATVWMTFAVLYILSLQVRDAQTALAAEHVRSEALLQNLLPDEIATRLKNSPGEVIADGLPAVTLLFADIVDFTPRSATRSPEDVVDFLNKIFSRFDQLTAKRGLEKIKTIGDAYMVAAGLPAPRKDHAHIIADMALAKQAAVADLSDQMGETVDLRIGIHSGPAIAGVIGTSKVFYDVWGDTVNTASRMESQGEPGRIQITSTTKSLLGDGFNTIKRGVLEIKGVGPIETWWLDLRTS